MPFANVSFGGIFIFLMLVLAIPVQFYISNNATVPQKERQASLRRLLQSISSFQYNYLSVHSWHRWCQKIWHKMDWGKSNQQSYFTFDDEVDESPAIDVIQHKHPLGHFATSTNVRSPRPAEVKFRVGQVVRHTIQGYRGVIVGWDPIAKAPEDWLNTMHPADKLHWRQSPNYLLLVDVRDRPLPQLTYVPQENLEVLTHTEIKHPKLQNYFDAFDGVEYIMRPALKYFYPRD